MRLFFLAGIAITLLFSSCDPQVCSTGFILNQSAGNLYLIADSTFIDTLQPGGTKTLGPICGLGYQGSSVIYYYESVRNDDTFCRKDIRWDTN